MSRKGFVGFIIFLVVAVILISFGIYLINCCSSVSPSNGGIWYYFVKYAGLHLILISVGGVLIVLDLIDGLYLIRKSRRKE